MMNDASMIMVVSPQGVPHGFDEKKQLVMETIRTMTPASIEELRAIIGYIPPAEKGVYDAVFEDEEIVATLRQQRMLVVAEARKAQMAMVQKGNHKAIDSLLRQYAEADMLGRLSGSGNMKQLDLGQRATIIITPPRETLPEKEEQPKILIQKPDAE